MSENNNPQQTPQGQVPEGSTPAPGQTPDSITQSQAAASGKTLSDDHVKELLEKARSDEKSKLYGKLDELKKAKEASDKQLEELNSKLAATLNDLDSIRKGKASELESVANEVKSLRENNDKLQKAIQETASSAAAQIREFEVKAYRERRIREAGVKLEELVVGQSEQEVDAAIETARKRELQLLEDYKKQLQQQAASNLPAPLAPDGTTGRGPSGDLSPQNRVALASLKGAEYEKRRQALLNDALEKSGLMPR